MRIYYIEHSATYLDFSQCTPGGTWDIFIPHKCNGEKSWRIIPPLVVEWVPGSVTIGDFVWCDLYCMCQDSVKEFLTASGYECDSHPVFFNEYTGGAGRVTKKRPIVEHPYKGPELSYLTCRSGLSVNAIETHQEVISVCPTCGYKEKKVIKSDIVIDRACWNGEKIFFLKENDGDRFKFVTEVAKSELERQSFTNIRFVEAGVIE